MRNLEQNFNFFSGEGHSPSPDPTTVGRGHRQPHSTHSWPSATRRPRPLSTKPGSAAVLKRACWLHGSFVYKMTIEMPQNYNEPLVYHMLVDATTEWSDVLWYVMKCMPVGAQFTVWVWCFWMWCCKQTTSVKSTVLYLRRSSQLAIRAACSIA